MFRYRHALRLFALVTVSLFSAACMTTATTDVKPEVASRIQTVELVALKPIDTFGDAAPAPAGTPYSPYVQGGDGGGLLGALIGGMIVGAADGYRGASHEHRSRQRVFFRYSAAEAIAHTDAVLARILRENFDDLAWFHNRPVRQFNGSEQAAAMSVIDGTNADSVAVAAPGFEFNSKFTVLTVTLDFAMYPVSARMQQAVNANPNAPQPFFRTQKTWTEKMPEERIFSAASNEIYWSGHFEAALKPALQYLAAELYAELTDPSAKLSAATLPGLAASEADPKTDNVFPTVTALNDWYRVKMNTVSAKWPANVFAVLRACRESGAVEECRAMKAEAEAERQRRLDRLVLECEAALVESGITTEQLAKTDTCGALLEKDS